MSYRNFNSLSKAIKAFDLTLVQSANAFGDTTPVKPSLGLDLILDRQLPLAQAMNSEKARSELVITPIMLEVLAQVSDHAAYFSGVSLNVDESAGLNGECDFVFSGDPNQFELTAPILTIVEAKNLDIKSGLGQCAAQMVAAQLFNGWNGLSSLTSSDRWIYGAVTTGDAWRFLRLADTQLTIDLTQYAVPTQIDRVLGILLGSFR